MIRPINRRSTPASVVRRLNDLDNRLNEFTKGDLRGKMPGEDKARLVSMQLQLRALRLRLERRMTFRPALTAPRRRAP